MVYKNNYEHLKGDSKAFIITVYTDSTKATLKDISGYVFKFTMKLNKDDTQGEAIIAVIETVVDGSSGKATVSIPAASFEVDLGLYYYDLEKTKPTGEVITELIGTFNIVQDITT